MVAVINYIPEVILGSREVTADPTPVSLEVTDSRTLHIIEDACDKGETLSGTVHYTGTAMDNYGVAADPDHNSEQDLEPRLCPARIGFA